MFLRNILVLISLHTFTLISGFSQAKIDPVLLNMNENETKNIFVKLFETADISGIRTIKGKENKTTFVYEKLLAIAKKSQNNIINYLDENNIPHRSFYIVNGISLKADKTLITKLSEFPEIEMIMEDGTFMMTEVEREKETSERTVEWGLNKIKCREVWSQGFRGQNVVIGGQDTGYKWDHVQLINKYRGWNGSVASHNYNWHDAIYQNHPMNPGNNSCGYNLSAPCDDNNHGTHTMGTMVGNHNTDTIGVAPDAKWIGCRNMERGYGLLSTYIECFEWFLAPYAYGDGPEEGDPSKMPHVINNSWGCPPIEGCNSMNIYMMEEALMNLRSAGCVIVVSNGNSGPNCSTTFDPPSFFDGSFSVGAINSLNVIAGFSSRGPVTFDSSNRLKPNVVAPGVLVRSSTISGYGTFSGTSMAGPHVAGAVALIISANPNLAGEVDQIEDILEQTTLPLIGGSLCGGIPATAIPNNTYGYGLIDVQKAVARARDSLYVSIIKVDQFGYRTTDKKRAILTNPIEGYNQADQYTPGSTIALKNSSTHQVVFSASPVSWNNGAIHSQSGDKVWYFDFSNFTTPGTYYVADGQVRSEDFVIQDTVYHQLLNTAFKTFYYQRCGISKSANHVHHGFVDNACHLQDTICKFYANPMVQSRWKNLSGGWHDAGDYNKYVNFAYAAVFDLLYSYHLSPEAWISDDFNIPESGNDIPDVLDEIRYETDWLMKMQESNGGVLSIVGVANFATASPPSADNSERLYGPATTSASFSAAAMLSFAATQFRKINTPEAQQYVNTLETSAINAYNWGVGNPNVTFYNAAIIGAGEQELDTFERSMRQLNAAIFLYDLTGNIVYKNYVESQYTQSHLIQWNFVYPFENPTQLALLYYAHLNGVTPSVALDIKNTYKNSIETSGDNLPAHIAQTDAYRSYLSNNNHTWGSNRTKTNMGNLYQAYHQYGLNVSNNLQMEGITTDYLNYIHGRNPTGLCYISNMEHLNAYKSINSIYHGWYTDGSALWDDVRKSTYGPAPGFISGGVNPNYSLDACCSNNSCGAFNSLCIDLQPPLQQPILKSYLDWNTGWPQNSWEITEPAIYYQSSYLFLLASKVNFAANNPSQNAPVTMQNGDIDIQTFPKGLVLTSVNGTSYRISVSNTGVLTSTIETNPIPARSELQQGNIYVFESQKGILLRSPNNSIWRMFINTQGQLYTESLVIVPDIHVRISNADLYLSQPSEGLILKDRDGLCYKVWVNDSGVLFSIVISCEG